MEKLQKINIIFEDNHLLVVEKPVNMPVCADNSNDLDLLSLLKKYIKEKYNKPGNVYLGLVHRLDRPVGGIMVFAKTSKAASRLSRQVQEHKLEKKYVAVCYGKVKEKEELRDYLFKDKKQNISYVTTKDKGKLSMIECVTQDIKKISEFDKYKYNFCTIPYDGFIAAFSIISNEIRCSIYETSDRIELAKHFIFHVNSDNVSRENIILKLGTDYMEMQEWVNRILSEDKAITFTAIPTHSIDEDVEQEWGDDDPDDSTDWESEYYDAFEDDPSAEWR